MAKSILLTKGLSCLVDDEDYERLMAFKWTAFDGRDGNYYAARYEKRDGRKVCIYMHRFLLNAGPGELVDHRFGNTLDNRKENLRKCTKQQNQCNQRKQRGRSSIYKGVTWDKRKRKWMAKIKTDGKTKNLGRFKDERDAARAYDRAAIEAYGEFARINFPAELAS